MDILVDDYKFHDLQQVNFDRFPIVNRLLGQSIRISDELYHIDKGIVILIFTGVNFNMMY